MKDIRKIDILPAIIVLIFLLGSCKKMIEVDLPINQTTSEYVFSNSSSATAAINSVYVGMVTEGGFVDYSGISISSGLFSDELVNNANFDRDYKNIYTPTEGACVTLWNNSYRIFLYRVNSVIEGINNSSTLDDNSRNILTGEAKFIRALTYFNLVNLFGDVPLVLNTDFKANSNVSRSPKADIYKQIIADLKDAQGQLSETYLTNTLSSGSVDRIRPNRGSATALLSRVYLYIEDWVNAELESSKIIANKSMYDLVDLDKVFLKDSKEAIWQLQPNKNSPEGGPNTIDGKRFLKEEGGYQELYLSRHLLSDFEIGDKRKDVWTKVINSPGGNFPVPYKYKLGFGSSEQLEYTTVFRLAEQYLIRAEARAHLGRLTGVNSASEDLNVIRNRSGLGDVNITTLNAALDRVLQERRVELFTEFGHRWYDLKRTGRIDQVMRLVAPDKGAEWDSYKSLLPIPATEFISNQAIKGYQNQGYTEF